MDEKAWKTFSVELQPDTEMIIQDFRGHITTDVLALRLPWSSEEVEEVRQEPNRIYQESRSREDYQTFENARRQLEQVQQRVLKVM